MGLSNSTLSGPKGSSVAQSRVFMVQGVRLKECLPTCSYFPNTSYTLSKLFAGQTNPVEGDHFQPFICARFPPPFVSHLQNLCSCFHHFHRRLPEPPSKTSISAPLQSVLLAGCGKSCRRQPSSYGPLLADWDAAHLLFLTSHYPITRSTDIGKVLCPDETRQPILRISCFLAPFRNGYKQPRMRLPSQRN